MDCRSRCRVVFTDCCREQGVARQCLAGCSGGVRLSSIRNLDSGCAIDLPKILHCAAGLDSLLFHSFDDWLNLSINVAGLIERSDVGLTL